MKFVGIKREKLHLIHYENKYNSTISSLRGSDDDGQSGTFFSDISDNIEKHIVRLPDNLLKWRIKSSLFDIIDDPAIKVLASVDCDTLFAQEGCASALLSKGLNWASSDAGIKVTSMR